MNSNSKDKSKEPDIDISTVTVGASATYVMVLNDGWCLIAGMELEFNMENLTVIYENNVIGKLVLL